ncbi:MAG TPA: DUF5615 family PIN-like protein [Acidobacteriaceae bacterium]|jgi:predicted nuclease of predicted toxin-antitoxin system|nr:DUF5615 family PIN-like protein [Acidobacteriaceae bacterium]
MKLLLDENLSRRLTASLGSLYPGVSHLVDCGLEGASDEEIWHFARENGFAIVTKDSDFSQRSAVRGSPPKVIWLRIGNCTTARAQFVLSNLVSRIQEFLLTGAEDCLILRHPR